MAERELAPAVLEARPEDLVALAQVERPRGEVDARGRVPDEDEIVGIGVYVAC
jgi:hypothetical protein